MNTFYRNFATESYKNRNLSTKFAPKCVANTSTCQNLVKNIYINKTSGRAGTCVRRVGNFYMKRRMPDAHSNFGSILICHGQ